MKISKRHVIGTLIAILVIFILAGWQVQRSTDIYEASSSSKFWVEGTSTIHDWTCIAPDVAGNVQFDWDANGFPVIENAQIRVPVQAMDCNHGKMDEKLQKALKLEDNPHMLFELNSVDVTAASDSFKVDTDGFLMLAGQTRRIQFNQYMTKNDDGTVTFRGQIPVAMKEYSIKPPTAVFGTIRTGNDVVVHFELVVELVSETM